MASTDPLKKILRALNTLNRDVHKFFTDNDVNKKTIQNSLKTDKNISTKTRNYFQKYIPSPWHGYNFEKLDPNLQDWLIRNSTNRNSKAVRDSFASILLLEHLTETPQDPAALENSDYIGQLQNTSLPFHDPKKQIDYWKKLHQQVRKSVRTHFFQRLRPGDYPLFDLSFLELTSTKIERLTCNLEGDSTPPESSDSAFAKKACSGPQAHDNPSFALTGFSDVNGHLSIKLQWTRYFTSLEQHDAYFMQSIYSFGSLSENKKIADLAERVAFVLRNNEFPTKPILGVTTAIAFKRDKHGPYWTFVQLKEGGASRIPESHLSPSFVHQPTTPMRHSLQDEANDIEFHIRRELIEEIFNFPEHAHSDFACYREIVNNHFAIRSLDALIEVNLAELSFHGLIMDTQRAKFELVYVLRIDDPAWFTSVGQHIRENQEAIRGGMVLAPFTPEGVHQALTGQLTYSKPIRRMCAPGQAGLTAAIRHLKKRNDPFLHDVQIGRISHSRFDLAPS